MLKREHPVRTKCDIVRYLVYLNLRTLGSTQHETGVWFTNDFVIKTGAGIPANGAQR